MNVDARYNISKRFAIETNALLCEKSQIVVSARMLPATASDTRTKAKVFLQGCPLAPDHWVHDLDALSVAGSPNGTGRVETARPKTWLVASGETRHFSHQFAQKPCLTSY